MNNSLFYKSLASLSTLGVIFIATTLGLDTFKKSSSPEEKVNLALKELRTIRKESLNEIKVTKKDVLEELNKLRTNSLNELKNDKNNVISDIKNSREEALKDINKATNKGEDANVWLLVRVGNNGREMGGKDIPVALEKFPMSDMSQCELQGAVVKAAEDINNYGKRIGVVCIEGN
tara:strand:- start:587 stop:1114 length:528 start_codon:yes stop_codon:yes gene_type:complete